jgi:hypothetical protein
MIGKRTQEALYVHRSAWSALPDELMQCSRNRETDGVRCEPEIFSMTEGEEPIAGLRRRSQRGKRR